MRVSVRTGSVHLVQSHHLGYVQAWLYCQAGFPALSLLVVVGILQPLVPLPDLWSPCAHTGAVVVVVGRCFLDLKF